MESIGACHAKTHLSKLLKRVKKGESIIITRHGVPIAVLQPFSPTKKKDTKSIINELREFREDTNANSEPPGCGIAAGGPFACIYPGGGALLSGGNLFSNRFATLLFTSKMLLKSVG